MQNLTGSVDWRQISILLFQGTTTDSSTQFLLTLASKDILGGEHVTSWRLAVEKFRFQFFKKCDENNYYGGRIFTYVTNILMLE